MPPSFESFENQPPKAPTGGAGVPEDSAGNGLLHESVTALPKFSAEALAGFRENLQRLDDVMHRVAGQLSIETAPEGVFVEVEEASEAQN